jgi:DNA-binding NarL/FixJ family response regulator
MEPSNHVEESVRVLVVEDHRVLGELIGSVIDSCRGFQVVGWAQTGTEAITLCEQTKPDLVILDLVLAAESGFAVLDKLSMLDLKTRVAVFSGNLTPNLVRRALAAGVLGVISKTTSLEEFRHALLAVAHGRTYFSPEVSTTIKGLVVERQIETGDGSSTLLTEREESILAYLAQGFSSREIASALGVSIYTVANYRSRLMKKTGLHRATQLSFYAMRRGLFGPIETPRAR